MQVPTSPRADLREETAYLVGHRLRHIARQHLLEMPLGEAVLALEEEGAGQLEVHPHQLGVGDQHLAEGSDRVVEQLVTAVALCPLSFFDRSHAVTEQTRQVVRRILSGRGGCGQKKHRESE